MSSKINVSDAINTGEISVGKLVAMNYKYAGVFTKFGIDFCCGGNISLNKIIEKKNLVHVEVKSALMSLTESTETVFEKMSLGTLIDHIIREHHSYLRENIPVIREHLDKIDKIDKVHSKKYPYIAELKNTFSELSSGLINHLNKEESILFRVIRYLEDCNKYSEKPRSNGYKSVKHILGNYIKEHEDAGLMLTRMRELTEGFTPPADACTTFRVCYMELKEFEENTHKHVHLENNILFPKAIELELSLGLITNQLKKERI